MRGNVRIQRGPCRPQRMATVLVLTSLLVGAISVGPVLGQDDAPAWYHEFHPGPRYGFAAAYDSGDSRLWLVGGISDETLLNDTWMLDLAGDGRWRALTLAEADRLPARGRHAAIVDTAANRLIVCGGQVDLEYPPEVSVEVWELPLDDPQAWSQLQTSGPGPARLRNHSAAFDGIRTRMLVVDEANEVWVLELSDGDWSPLPVLGNLPSQEPGVAYDPSANQLYFLFPPGVLYAAILEQDAQWSLVDARDGPRPRDAYNLSVESSDRLSCIDSRLSRWTLDLDREEPRWVQHLDWRDSFRAGGPAFAVGSGQAVALNDYGTWYLDATSGEDPAWAALEPAALMASGSSVVHDTSRDEWLVFGGSLPAPGQTWAPSNQLWALRWEDEINLRPVPVEGELPPARDSHIAILDESRNRMLVLGGFDYREPELGTEVWALTLGDSPQWDRLETVDDPPLLGVKRLRGAYDPSRDRLLLLTPEGGRGWLHDVWALELEEPARFVRLRPQGLFDGFSNAADVFDPERDRWLFVDSASSIWSLDFSRSSEGSWVEHTAYGEYPLTDGSRSICLDGDENRIVVHGGTRYYDTADSRTYVLDLDEPMTWTRLAPTGWPLPRHGHLAIWNASLRGMAVFGHRQYTEYTREATVSGLSVLRFPLPPEETAIELSATRDARVVELTWNPPGEAVNLRATVMRRVSEAVSLLGTVSLAAGKFIDHDPPDEAATYWLEIEREDRPFVLGEAEVRPAVFATRLLGAVPNPFNPQTRILFELQRPGHAELVVFDLAGRRVRTLWVGSLKAGAHEARWDGRDEGGTPLASGVYVCRLQANGFAKSQRLTLIK